MFICICMGNRVLKHMHQKITHRNRIIFNVAASLLFKEFCSCLSSNFVLNEVELKFEVEKKN